MTADLRTLGGNGDEMAQPIIPGIYSITSKTNFKVYFGSSKDIHKRWGDHQRDLRHNRHSNSHLQNHVNKYGLNDLVFALEEVEPDPVLRLGLEQLMITALYGEGCFNCAAHVGSPGGPRGVPKTPEHKAKIAASNKGQKRSPETKSRLSVLRTGTRLTPEVQHQATLKRRATLAAHPMTDETRASLATFKGRKHSPGTLVKMSLSQKGHPVSPESRAKMRAARKAYWAEKRTQQS